MAAGVKAGFKTLDSFIFFRSVVQSFGDVGVTAFSGGNVTPYVQPVKEMST